MTFLIVLIALILERFFHWHHVRHWRWFANYERWLSVRMSAMPAALILTMIVAPPLLIIGVLQYCLAGWWWGALEFVLGVVVLLYCLGPDNLWVQVYRCMNDLSKEEPAGIERVQAAFHLPPTDHSKAFHHAFTRAIFWASHQRIFAVLFWFVLLGPVGAVLYRLVESVNTQTLTGAKLAEQLQGLLDWLPVRVEAFLFALGGHFTAVFGTWRRDVFKGPSSNDAFLAECGMAALDVDRVPEAGSIEKEALALIDRAFVIGLVILAMLVLFW